jgi:hypothetical protein
MPLPDKRISKLTLGTSRGLFEIFAPLYMYKMMYSFPLKKFVRVPSRRICEGCV